MAKDPQVVAQLYRSGVAGGAPKYKAGVSAAASDWESNAKSEASEANYAAGVARAAADKSRQKALQNVSGTEWAKAAADVGSGNYAAAAGRAAVKFEQNIPDILAAGDAAKAAAKAIPGTTMEQRLQRGPAAATAVHRHWARKKGTTPEV